MGTTIKGYGYGSSNPKRIFNFLGWVDGPLKGTVYFERPFFSLLKWESLSWYSIIFHTMTIDREKNLPHPPYPPKNGKKVINDEASNQYLINTEL